MLSIVAACGDKDDAQLPSQRTPALGNGVEDNGNENNGNPAENSKRAQLAEQYGLPYDPAMDEWEPITFKYYHMDVHEAPAEDNPIIKIVEEITNVKIEFLTYGNDLDLIMDVLFTTRDVPDMAYFGNEAAAAVESGLFIRIDDLIEDHAPRLRAHYDPWWERMKYTDGNIYTAEIYGTPVGIQTILWTDGPAFWIQKSILDYFDRAPVDIDEYFDFIREYKEENPTIDETATIGFAVESYEEFNSGVIDPGYFLAGNANWGGAINAGGSFSDAPISPEERWTADFNLMWWRKLNEEFRLGTLPSGTFRSTHDEYLAQISSGAVLGMFDYGWVFQSAQEQLIEEDKLERTYLPLALTYPGVEANYLDLQTFTGNNGINFSGVNSDPIRAVQYLDWIVDESVQRFLYWGIEGEHYYYDENGRIARPQEQRELQEDEKWVNDNLGRILYETMPKMQGSYPSDNNPTSLDQSPEEHFASLPLYDRDLFEKLGIFSMTGFLGEPKARPVFYPFWTMHPEEDSEAQQTLQEIDDIIGGAQVLNLILSPERNFEDRLEAYLEAMTEINHKPLMDFFTAEAEKRLGE